METKIAGKIASSLCRCLVKSRPNKGLPAFLPNAMEVVDSLLTEEMNEKLVDEELKFNLLIMSEVRNPAIQCSKIRKKYNLGNTLQKKEVYA